MLSSLCASFIGSPAMNLMPVTYKNGMVSDGNGIELVVSEPDRKVLDNAGYDGKEIIFGIRPEDIHTEQIALDTSPETVREPTITVSELTGAESILYLDFGGTELVAVVDARDYHQPGEKTKVAFNMNKAHFFDRENERVIRKKSAVEQEEASIK